MYLVECCQILHNVVRKFNKCRASDRNANLFAPGTNGYKDLAATENLYISRKAQVQFPMANSSKIQTERKPVQKSFLKKLSRYWEIYLLFLPVAAWFIIFCYVPMGGLIIAFKDFSPLRGIWESPWVGLANFEKMFSMPSFLVAIKNTLIISLLNLLIVFPVPILFAILLNELPWQRFKKAVQTVSYLPHFISWSVVASLVYMLLAPNTGVINHLIELCGGTSQNFLGISKYFRTILISSSIWGEMGWSAIVYIAAISGVDEQLYEAAYVDGASRWKRIWHITLPGIRSTVAVLLILQVGNILSSNFGQIFAMANDTVMDVAETIDYYVYRVGLKSANNFSVATAAGMIKSFVGLILVVVTNKVSKKITDGEGIW